VTLKTNKLQEITRRWSY